MSAFVNRSGQQYGRLTAHWPAGINGVRGKNQQILWLCSCECGNLKIVRSSTLPSQRSCGCEASERLKVRLTIHGKTGSGAHRSYCLARSRCNNANNPKYGYYGGRGIEFRFASFLEFYAALGDRPDGLTLDRINSNGHYELGNCRWATRKEQVHNQRRKTKHV